MVDTINDTTTFELLDNKNLRFYVGVESIGYAYISDCKNISILSYNLPDEYKNKKGLGVMAVNIKESMRGQGYGITLMNEIKERAIKDNYDFIVLAVEKRNTIALNLYQKLKYESIFEFFSNNVFLMILNLR
jgi:ribosomal protein S18 acetylase RimI-like enzyme